MKKRLLPLVLCALLAFAFVANAETPVTLKVDGVKVSSEVAAVNGTTLIPVEVLSETLGAQVDWTQSDKQIKIETAAYTVVFTIDSKDYTVNGVKKTVAVAPKLLNNKPVVPLKAFAEAIGATVGYAGATKTVTVDYFTKVKGTIKISGSTTLQPVVQAAADKLVKANSGLSISVAGGGSGAGIKDAIAGTNNIGMSSRELTNEEQASLKPYAVAKDGIAIIVHPNNPVVSLTKEQAAKIFLGEIKNWKDVGGANAPILVQTRETGSGTRSTLEEMLLNKTSVVATATPSTSSQLIKQAVAKSVNAIGYDSIGFLDNTVKALSLDGKSPTAANVKSKSYSMGRELYIVSKGAPTGLSALFIDYLRSNDVQKNIVVKEGYLELN